MSRFILVLLAIVSALSLATAQQPAKPHPESDTARKVRVALALAGGCGTCRADLDECRADAIKTGKPLVLFVGGCDGRAKELDSTAIYCRVEKYTVESKPVEGVVILGKEKGQKADVLFVQGQLPKTATVAEIKAAVKSAAANAPAIPKTAPLDWDFGGKHEPEPADDHDGATDGNSSDTETTFATPVSSSQSPVLLADCPNGRCPVPTSSATYSTGPGAVRVTAADDGSGGSVCMSSIGRRKLFNWPILNRPVLPWFQPFGGIFRPAQ